MDQMAEWDDESLDDVENPEFRAHDAAVLKDWSAQDFANIYTRFRPHLERHARKFLKNQHQVDEVVQDAFLYLMVTLPELDSEIGVLRFLKWKVRLLCLDVIRASGRAIINNIDDIAEPASRDEEVGSEMEHIEDAAIVRLALSKLNPRHREVLLASMYEEKSTREIAAQVGLSENATLQLIFRARAAFKKALLGADVDTTGMSVTTILSVAARKAAQEAKKVSAQAMVFVLFLIVAAGAFLNLGGTGKTPEVAQGQATEPSSSPSASEQPSGSETQAPTKTGSVSTVAYITKTTASKLVADPGQKIAKDYDLASRPVPVSESDVQSLLNQTATQAIVVRRAQVGQSESIDLDSETGVRAHFIFVAGSAPRLSDLSIKFSVGDSDLTAFPKFVDSQIATDSNGNRVLTYTGSLAYIVDENDWIITDQILTSSQVRLRVVTDSATGKYASATLEILANN
jgi:RNA polymerase sigma factor (sigma-70 family)